ncbi:DNA-binding protein [Flavobacterium noncentrifugens]|uniref:cAMP-binding domain of CRP or a regulatory subunit of cAMP-dependent protein kinases n=1 Tax=Flavobacterium noncentrifugens TaxID=1128970 RepID=A0A1G8SKC7_9FLAO|nr:Crp/Fnr family transcriptional regulator [Flavobacterium noncentrifugens]GEP49870.1 DNA-binding protein [Flavobacterium noncentrifugens]SDJ29699.1 cAMP-binding domain of CRP or a regulatory subunit of cAMP-dependent protein kinases [Flavobacterium noncentrifugens]
MAKNANHFFDYIEMFLNSDDLVLKELVLQSKNAFTPLHLKKNDFFVREGEICPYFCYIESGILQHAIEIDGEEKTTYLALRNSVTSSLNSFLFGKPSRKNIKAISDCELYVIDLPNFKKLVETNVAFHQFYYNLIEKQLCLIDDYRIDLLTLTPEERYLKLLSTEPKLLQEVPLHYLASFLGISARHMSRIRKNMK